MTHPTRRTLLRRALVGAGALGLRSLASGVPAAILADPRRALAAAADARPPQFLILANSGDGDPMGCNTPGTYDDDGIVHPPGAGFAATDVVQGGVARRGAAIWAGLPPALLDRLVFFHHGTFTVVHGDNAKTLELQGAVSGFDMVVSMAARQLAGQLSTVQQDPISLGGTVLTSQRRTLPVLPPQALSAVLLAPDSPLSGLEKLRDQTLDRLGAWVKARGNASQSDFIDRYATSQAQLRNLSDNLIGALSSIRDNTPASQIVAAVALMQMNVSAVVAIKVPFGGDNHSDADLAREATQQAAGVTTLANLYQQLSAAGLADKVSFAAINVFGRTMAVSHEGTSGRDHNGNHHTTLMFGRNLRGGVVGGVHPVGADYGAMAIDAATGQASASGDIPAAAGLAAMGKTLGAAVGLSDAVVEANITGGQVVTGALA